MKHFFNIHKYEFIMYFAFLAIGAFCLFTEQWLWLLLIPSVYVCILAFEYIRYAVALKTPLDIKTPDSSDEPYHPSVAFIPEKLNGYKYYMAFTPLPSGTNPQPYVDRYECPCVYASSDGVHFSDVGKNGFLDDLSQEEIDYKDFFSDTHIVYNAARKELELFYRLSSHKGSERSQDGDVCLFRKTSRDGITWSERELLIDTTTNKNIGSILVSPAIIIVNDCYYMWYVSSFGSNRKASFSKSRDCCNWSDSEEINFIGRKVDPWHIDCILDNGKFIMTVYEFTNELTLWESVDGISFHFKKVVLRTSGKLGSFYSGGLYRACLVVDEKYSLYFSGRYSNYCCIGLAQSSDLVNFSIVNGGKQWSFKWFLKDFSKKYLYLPNKLISILSRIKK